MLTDIYMKFVKIASSYRADTILWKSSSEISQKAQMLELWFLRSARRLILIDICMKFREDSLNCFQVKERTRYCDG